MFLCTYVRNCIREKEERDEGGENEEFLNKDVIGSNGFSKMVF